MTRQVGALPTQPTHWPQINWEKCHQIGARLQARIVKATQEGKRGKVKALQWLLTHSFSAKAIAVKRVTENKGKKTPGIDGQTWSTPWQKFPATVSLHRRGYHPKPVRRIYIPKANGKKRPLGIPPMQARAMQALHLLALDPVAETTADPCSDGFRTQRSTADAIGSCFRVLAMKTAPPWILEGDIEACFEGISHQWLLAPVTMDKRLLQGRLQAGIMEEGK